MCRLPSDASSFREYGFLTVHRDRAPPAASDRAIRRRKRLVHVSPGARIRPSSVCTPSAPATVLYRPTVPPSAVDLTAQPPPRQRRHEHRRMPSPIRDNTTPPCGSTTRAGSRHPACQRLRHRRSCSSLARRTPKCANSLFPTRTRIRQAYARSAALSRRYGTGERRCTHQRDVARPAEGCSSAPIVC